MIKHKQNDRNELKCEKTKQQSKYLKKIKIKIDKRELAKLHCN